MKSVIERPVDTWNVFSYENKKFKINQKLKQYEVKNYPVLKEGSYNNWTNYCEMDSILVIDDDGVVKFLDQNGKDITIHVKQI